MQMMGNAKSTKQNPAKQGKMPADNTIIFHADDFGMDRESSRHILDCFEDGVLNSLSVLPNSSRLSECMAMLEPCRDQIKVSMHLNLAEGHCVADMDRVPLLVDSRGMFCVSFFGLLLMSLGRRRKELQKQIIRELRAQMDNLLPYVDTVRIDSHQHYHLIPIVLRSILRVAEEKGREISFIRIPAEPVLPFLKHPKLYGTYRPINFVKNVVLNVLYIMDRRLLKPYRKKTAVFFGILLSGNMDLKRVSRLMPDFKRIADKKGLPLEVLCHPGGVENTDAFMDRQNLDCVQFYLSDGRKREKEMLLGIRKNMCRK